MMILSLPSCEVFSSHGLYYGFPAKKQVWLTFLLFRGKACGLNTVSEKIGVVWLLCTYGFYKNGVLRI